MEGVEVDEARRGEVARVGVEARDERRGAGDLMDDMVGGVLEVRVVVVWSGGGVVEGRREREERNQGFQMVQHPVRNSQMDSIQKTKQGEKLLEIQEIQTGNHYFYFAQPPHFSTWFCCRVPSPCRGALLPKISAARLLACSYSTTYPRLVTMDCIIRRSLLSATSRSTASTSRTALFHSSRLARQDAPSPSTATPTPSDDNSPPPPTATEGESETSAAAAEENTVFDADTGRGGKGFRNWLNSDGARYRHGVKGKTNWLGDTVSHSVEQEKLVLGWESGEDSEGRSIFHASPARLTSEGERWTRRGRKSSCSGMQRTLNPERLDYSNPFVLPSNISTKATVRNSCR